MNAPSWMIPLFSCLQFAMARRRGKKSLFLGDPSFLQAIVRYGPKVPFKVISLLSPSHGELYLGELGNQSSWTTLVHVQPVQFGVWSMGCYRLQITFLSSTPIPSCGWRASGIPFFILMADIF